jgi:hypothetical protein
MYRARLIEGHTYEKDACDRITDAEGSVRLAGHDMQGGSVDSVFFSLRVQESFSEGLAPRQLLGT